MTIETEIETLKDELKEIHWLIESIETHGPFANEETREFMPCVEASYQRHMADGKATRAAIHWLMDFTEEEG